MGRPRKPTAIKEANGAFKKNPQRRPKNQPLPPDDDGDGVPNAADMCPNTSPGELVDADGCTLLDLTAGQTMPLCGACGAMGMISWSLLLLGFLGLRTRSNRYGTQ